MASANMFLPAHLENIFRNPSALRFHCTTPSTSEESLEPSIHLHTTYDEVFDLSESLLDLLYISNNDNDVLVLLQWYLVEESRSLHQSV